MKKAFTWLEAHGVEYEFHDYKKLGVPPGKLKDWARKVGWERLANLRGPTWRKLPEAQKPGLSEARALALLERNPSAIRRPILEAGVKLLVGFEPDEFRTAIAKRG